MATYGKKLLDSNNNVILPKTRSSLVYMNNDETLEKTIEYIINGTTVVGKATKLATARNIGNASFDGSKDIGLEDIGAISDTVSSQTITLTSSYGNLTVRLRKIGKMCFGTTSGNLDFQTTQLITFSELIPSEFCPIDHVNRFAYSAFITGKVVAGYIQILDTRKVSAYVNTKGYFEGVTSFSYITSI